MQKSIRLGDTVKLDKIYRIFPTKNDCINFIENIYWDGVPTCPYCQSKNCTPFVHETRYHCNNCFSAFSVTVNTVFHHTHLPMQIWFLAINLILNERKPLSARQLSKYLKTSKNTSWSMITRIQKAMSDPKQRLLLQHFILTDEKENEVKSKRRV